MFSSRWTDFFQLCSPYNPSCVVDWDAWSVLIAALVGAAVWILGRNTNRLADASNRTNELALRLEREAKERQAAIDEREGKLLLLYIYTDVIIFTAEVGHVLERFGHPDYRKAFVDSYSTRKLFLEQAGKIRTGVMGTKLDRAHVLPDQLAGRLQQIVGGIKAIRAGTAIAEMRAPGNAAAGEDLDMLLKGLLVLEANGALIIAACQKVVEDMGLSEASLTREQGRTVSGIPIRGEP